MKDNDAAEIQLDLRELAAWEISHQAQASALARLRGAAVARQLAHILVDPAGRALAVATTDGTLHLIDPPVLPPDAGRDRLDVVIDDAPEPGFYANRNRTFYVTAARRIYRLRAPGQWASLQLIPVLPDGCEEVDASDCDHDLCVLAESADALEEHFGRGGRSR